MTSKATSVEAYLDELPADRRSAIEAVRKVVKKNVDKKVAEGMYYGMICWHIPHKVYPAGYHCDPKIPLPFVALASQKNYMSLYMFCDYVSGEGGKNESWFRDAWAKSGKKLDMGKSCIRFKKVEDLALDVIAEALQRMPVTDFISYYESVLAKSKTYAKKAAKK